tara:strand:- start:686 stop:868 length:183 start_codon:yes stop_codon:yes gene_type:complete
MNPDIIAILTRGLLGTATSGAALATSMNGEVKYWLQVSSLVVGIIVGALTAASLIKSMRK